MKINNSYILLLRLSWSSATREYHWKWISYQSEIEGRYQPGYPNRQCIGYSQLCRHTRSCESGNVRLLQIAGTCMRTNSPKTAHRISCYRRNRTSPFQTESTDGGRYRLSRCRTALQQIITITYNWTACVNLAERLCQLDRTTVTTYGNGCANP